MIILDRSYVVQKYGLQNGGFIYLIHNHWSEQYWITHPMTGSEANKMTYLEYQDGGQSNLKDLASSDRGKPRQQKLNYLFLILFYYQGSYKIHHKTWTFDRHACYYFGVPIWRRWLQDLILDAWSSIIQISGLNQYGDDGFKFDWENILFGLSCIIQIGGLPLMRVGYLHLELSF